MKLHEKIKTSLFKGCLFIFCLCVFPQLLQAQDQKVNLQGTFSMQAVFSEIEKQTNLSVDYDESLIDRTKEIKLNISNKKLSEALNEILQTTACTYVIRGKHIVITKQTLASGNQSHRIEGKISDQTGETVVGASVIEKGTSNGVMTDLEGNFALNVADNAVLVVSSIGYRQQEIAAGKMSYFTIRMETEMDKLDEVVVIGYGTTTKRDLTGAVSSIKTEKLLAEAPRSVQDLLRSNVAGLNIGYSDNAKGSADLQIRGKNTLTAGSGPLVVLDGVIYEGELTDINPNDIESADVLKDASSAAVFGAKSANGVLVITTRKGRLGKPAINFNSNIGFVTLVRSPNLLDADGFIRYRQLYETGKSTDEYLTTYPEIFNDPRKLSGVDQLTWYNYDQKTPLTELPNEETLLRAWVSRLDFKSPEADNFINNRITDWKDEVFRTGLQQDYNVSVSNRNDNGNYYLSFGYADREGVIEGDRFTNLRTRLNLESQLTKFLTIGANTGFAVRNEGFMSADWGQMVNISPFGANEIDNPDSPYRQYPTGNITPVNPFYDNLYRDRKKEYNTLNSNIYAQIKLPLDIEYQVNFVPQYVFYEYYNHESSKHADWAAKGGTAVRENQKTFSWQLDNILRWKKEFNNRHNVEVTLLANAEKLQSWRQQMNGEKFNPSDVLGYHRMQSAETQKIESDDQYQTGDALMGRLFYSFKHKYMITASVRRDGFSAFGQQNPRATFPAIALGWTFTSEQFAQSIASWFNYGKLRLSWGENGNRSIGRYEALSYLTSSAYPYIDFNGNVYKAFQVYVDRMSNKQLKWERTASYNIGLDFGFLQNRLSGSVEIYQTYTNDLLVSRNLPEISGFNSVMSNLGQLQNRGFEFTLNANLIQARNFTWTASGNFALNRRTIKKLYGDMVNVVDAEGNVIGQKEADDITNKWFIGQDPDRHWNYQPVGVWKPEEAEEAKKYGLQPGDFKYVDQTEDGIMTNDDKVFMKYSTPRFRWNLRNEFTFYRNISLSFMMYSYWGHYGVTNRVANNSGFPDRCSEYDQPFWTPDNLIDNYARIGSKNIGDQYRERSFIQLENIALSYNLPQDLLKKISIQNARVSFSVRNVAVYAPHWDKVLWDPETGGLSPRTCNISLNFTL